MGEDAAIVTDIEGTTRDVLTRDVAIGKTLLSLSDTAGIRESRDEVERIGIERTFVKIKNADLILAVFDGRDELSSGDNELISEIGNIQVAKIAIINKCDGERHIFPDKFESTFDSVIEISAKCEPNGAKDKLAQAIDSLFIDDKLEIGTSAIVTNARQNATLVRAEEHIRSALSALSDGLFQDAAASDIERALECISELDGGSATDEVLATIFSKFCVGK